MTAHERIIAVVNERRVQRKELPLAEGETAGPGEIYQAMTAIGAMKPTGACLLVWLKENAPGSVLAQKDE